MEVFKLPFKYVRLKIIQKNQIPDFSVETVVTRDNLNYEKMAFEDF